MDRCEYVSDKNFNELKSKIHNDIDNTYELLKI